MRDLFAPDTVKSKTFQATADKLEEHYVSKSYIIVEIYSFHSIKQAELQSSKDFTMALRKQANKCNFGEANNDTIRDKIVIGVYDENTWKRLPANPKLTLQKATDTISIEK